MRADPSITAFRRSLLDERIRGRLGDLSNRLGRSEWLDGPFSAGDLLMVTVLRRLEGTNILAAHPDLAAYVARGEARPAYARAFAAQKAVFDTSPEEDTHAH
jgi:glutathione S-transferase